MAKKSILEIDNFDLFLTEQVEKITLSERGKKKALAEFINIHPTSLSQIFNKTRVFTDEQVFLLCEFLNLSEMENQYVFLLYQISTTQNRNYKARLIKRRDTIRKKSLNLSLRIEKDKTLSEEEKSLFYSAWYYTCIWVFISIDGGKTKDEIIQRFSLNPSVINLTLDFLVRADLAYQERGRFFHKINRTHLEKTSPYLKQHHANWRIKSIQNKDQPKDKDLSFTAPLSLSRKDYDHLREEMVGLIKKVSDKVNETSPEEIYCFNMDFFQI